FGHLPRLSWSPKSTGSPDSASRRASSPKSNSSFQLSISSSRTNRISAVNGQPALERKPSSGPMRLSRRNASTFASSNAPPAALEVALLHLGELVLPVAGQLGLGQVLDAEPAQQRHELERLRTGNELAAFAMDVLLVDEAFDDRGARRRRAEALFLHSLAQLV